jgi:homocysteine S-methyltransferase
MLEKYYSTILTEGSMYDRLKRECSDIFCEDIGHLSLLFFQKGREALTNAYLSYFNIAIKYSIPIILHTPTWGANPERMNKSKKCESDINTIGPRFLIDILPNQFRNLAIVSGNIRPKEDCYSPELAPNEFESIKFHEPQISALANSEVDLIMPSTLPSFKEALGMARLLAETKKPYALSFVVTSEGNILDGTPLSQAVRILDEQKKPPEFVMVNCVHPSIFKECFKKELEKNPSLSTRVLGLQGNTAKVSALELLNTTALQTEDAKSFAAATFDLKTSFGMKILGGCCGTNEEHIEEIAKLITFSK